MQKAYQLYFKDGDSKFYVRAVILGGNPFIQIVPAWFDEEIAIYEEDKATEYVRMLTEQFSEANGLEFGMEEVTVDDAVRR